MTGHQAALDALLPHRYFVEHVSAVGGGCISQSQRLVVRDASNDQISLFAKSNDVEFLDNFECEHDGLMALAATATIETPQPMAVGVAGDRAWLIMPWIEMQESAISGRAGFFQTFGRQLADLHRCTQGTVMGAARDNYLGAARQVNEPSNDWCEFVADRRIGFQLRWAIDQKLADATLQQDVQQVVDRMARLLSGRDQSTSLLHGDLWSGNYLANAANEPVIIDPAVHRGCREAEFGMLKLFGGCPREFYDAYQQSWPMPGGWERRSDVYVLYHLLNHLNLFGSGYLQECKFLAKKLLKHLGAKIFGTANVPKTFVTRSAATQNAGCPQVSASETCGSQNNRHPQRLEKWCPQSLLALSLLGFFAVCQGEQGECGDQLTVTLHPAIVLFIDPGSVV